MKGDTVQYICLMQFLLYAFRILYLTAMLGLQLVLVSLQDQSLKFAERAEEVEGSVMYLYDVSEIYGYMIDFLLIIISSNYC